MNRRDFVKTSVLASVSGLRNTRAAEISTGATGSAAELLQNGGFEEPITEELAENFDLNQQKIPGWQFAGGSVKLVNHTRLLTGEGFQSLLLPCGDNELASVQQVFELGSHGPVRISFMLAASKAVDGEIGVFLDSKNVKVIRLSEFWKPEEIALTDQMKWRSISLPDIQMGPGKHTLGFRVLKFNPRVDRQGDKRDSVQGILLDGVSVQHGPPRKLSAGETRRAWPVEKNVKYEAIGVLPLEGVAGPWSITRTLACYPSLANFFGALRSTKELGGLQYLHFVDTGVCELVINAISLDGRPVFCDESRWYPHQLLTRTQAGPLDIEATTRMVFADHGALTQFAFTNQSAQPVTRTLEMNLQFDRAISRPDPNTVVIPDSPPRAYRFTVAPDQVVTSNGTTSAKWKISLEPHAVYELGLALAMEKTAETALEKAQQWGGTFDAGFAEAKAGWEKRWQEIFTPGNPTYSGCLPTLETEDQALRELYYLSIASLLETERDNFPLFKQSFVAATPEWCRDSEWFWDNSLTSLPYALMSPAAMKEKLRYWFTIDWRSCNSIELRDGTTLGRWSSPNAYDYFLALYRYLTVTGDTAFLAETVKGKTVFEYMEGVALDWKTLVPSGAKLMDIGGDPWNLLEAPPNYVHTVASLNAANIWMMRQLADYHSLHGNSARAAELRDEANALVPELMKLYNPNTGSWFVMFPGGKMIDSRHVYDYLTVGTCISEDLKPDVKTGMMEFVDRELMTKTWLRAMSRQDPSAFDSDRSDHGPAGSYSGWPAKTGQATAELGRFDKALDMFHRFRQAFDSAIPQAIELTKVEGEEGLQPRVSTRAGASFAEVSGSFADVIICTFFGFRPSADGKSALWKPQVSRGFNGRLLHIRWQGGLYTIVSDESGLSIEKE